MPFPDPSLAPPALNMYQMSYRGLVFGGIQHGSPYQLAKFPEGLGAAPIVSGDVQRAQDQGEFTGLDLHSGRNIALELVVQSDELSLDHARQQIAGSLVAGGQVEEPFFIQMPSGVFACMARPRKGDYQIDITTLLAGGTPIPIMMHATDPRWYSVPTKTATVGLPPPLGGLTFPVTFPASFGGGGTGGILAVHNYGTFEMRPIFVVTGPCTNPRVTNLSITGAPSIGATISLNAGDTLAIDTDFQSVVYTTAGSTVGVSRRNLLVPTSTWFNFPPGLNTVEFNTSDGVSVAGTLTVQSADAYAGL